MLDGYGSLIEAVSDLPGAAAVVRDADLRLVWCDHAYARLFQTEPQDLLGTLPRSVVGSERRAEQAVLSSGKTATIVQLWRGRRCLARCTPLPNGGGAAKGLLTVLAVGTCAPEPDEAAFAEASELAELAALSPRELDVFYWLGRGDAANELAARLYRSAKTVERHTESIFSKLGVRRRVDLAIFAAERGLTRFTPEQWSRIVAAREYRRGGRAGSDPPNSAPDE